MRPPTSPFLLPQPLSTLPNRHSWSTQQQSADRATTTTQLEPEARSRHTTTRAYPKSHRANIGARCRRAPIGARSRHAIAALPPRITSIVHYHQHWTQWFSSSAALDRSGRAPASPLPTRSRPHHSISGEFDCKSAPSSQIYASPPSCMLSSSGKQGIDGGGIPKCDLENCGSWGKVEKALEETNDLLLLFLLFFIFFGT